MANVIIALEETQFQLSKLKGFFNNNKNKGIIDPYLKLFSALTRWWMHPDQLAESNQEGCGNCISELQLCEHNKFITGPLILCGKDFYFLTCEVFPVWQVHTISKPGLYRYFAA